MLNLIFSSIKEVPLIDDYIKRLNANKLDLSVDFGWFYFLTKPLFYALNFLSTLFQNLWSWNNNPYNIYKNYIFPLANKMFKSMNSENSDTRNSKVRERFKDDRAKMNQEMFALYKEKN